MARERRLVLFRRPTVVGLELAVAPCVVPSYGGGVADELVSAGTLGLRAWLSLVVISILMRRAQMGTGAHGGGGFGRQGGWPRRVGWGGSPSPGLVGWEIGHGIFWVAFVECSTFFGECWAIWRRASMCRPGTTGYARRGPLAWTQEGGMTYACAVCALFHPNARIPRMAVFLAFKTLDWQLYVFMNVH